MFENRFDLLSSLKCKMCNERVKNGEKYLDIVPSIMNENNAGKCPIMDNDIVLCFHLECWNSMTYQYAIFDDVFSELEKQYNDQI